MRTMDQGQLQLLLNAAAAIQSSPLHRQPPSHIQNPMMLFSSMTTQTTTPSASIWPAPIKPLESSSSSSSTAATSSTTTSSTGSPSSLNMASLQQLLLLQQAIQQSQQAAALAQMQAQQPVIATPPVLQPAFNFSSIFPTAVSTAAAVQTIQTVQTVTPNTTATTTPPILTPHSLTPPSAAATPPDMFTIKFLQMRALEAQEAAAAQKQMQSQKSPARAPTAPPAQLAEQQQQQQQQQQQPLEALRKISTVSMPVEFVQVLNTPTSASSGPSAPSTASSQPSSSPSTSSKKEEEDEEDDEEEFVDIESVDVAIDGKEKRKAHVEFYRRMKYMRQHYRDKILTCSICKKKVENHENAISVHVAEHAEAGCYQCRLCGWQAVDKYKIYAHMRSDHPRKVDMFVDRRDMPKMCNCLLVCFPKTSSRPKKESNRSADTYLTEMLKGHLIADKTCEVCKAKVRRDKAAMIRHVQTNHTIKCKTCKTITGTLEEQLAHQNEAHQLKEPKMSVHYAPSAAAIYLLPALERAFPHQSS